MLHTSGTFSAWPFHPNNSKTPENESLLLTIIIRNPDQGDHSTCFIDDCSFNNVQHFQECNKPLKILLIDRVIYEWQDCTNNNAWT